MLFAYDSLFAAVMPAGSELEMPAPQRGSGGRQSPADHVARARQPGGHRT